MRAVLRFLTGDGEGGSTEIDDEHGDWWPKVAPFAAMVPSDTTWYCTPVVDNEQANLAQRELLGAGFVSHPGATTAPREDQDPEPDGAQMTDQDLKTRLKEPFPPQVLGTLNKGGRRLTYVPIAEVIVRLNDTFGVDGWSTEIVRAYRDSGDPDWIIAHVRLTADIDGKSVMKEAFGGQAVKRTNNADKAIVDLGDEFKGAISDALKKAAQQFGIGIELARKEEALRWEAAHEGGEQQAPAQQTAPARAQGEQPAALASEEERAYITKGIDELIEKAKVQFREWWKENSLPKPSEVTAAQYPAVKEALDMFLEAQRKYLAQQEAKKAEAAAPEAGGGMSEGQAVDAVKEAFEGAEQVQYAPGEEPFD